MIVLVVSDFHLGKGKFLKNDDVIKISISELGHIQNKVIDEPDSTTLF